MFLNSKSLREVNKYSNNPMGNIRSVFLTIRQCILSAKLIKTHSFRLFFWWFYPSGKFHASAVVHT